MNLNRHKSAFSPLELSLLIEKTELIHADCLGLIICEDGSMYSSISIFNEAYVNYTSKELRLLMVLLAREYDFLNIRRQHDTKSNGINSKRKLLDILNSSRLCLEPTLIIKSLIKTTETIFGSESKMTIPEISDENIKALLTVYPFRRILRKVSFSNDEKIKYERYCIINKKINATENLNWSFYDEETFAKEYKMIINMKK